MGRADRYAGFAVSAAFKIRNVRMIGAERSYEWELADGVNVIEGPVGVGKTSLLELIRWGLGGNAILSSAVRQVGRQLALTIELAGEPLILIRGIASHKSRVAIHDADGAPLTTTRTGHPQEQDSISHLLMSRLGIPEVRVPRSRRNPAGQHTSISFSDVYDYMYLQQTEIDRSTANHLDAVRDPKRRSTFELLYGLIDPQTAQLKVELGTLATELEQAQTAEREIDRFVASLELPSRERLEQRIQGADGVEEALQRELRHVRREMRAADAGVNPTLRLAEQLSEQLTDAVAGRERAIAQVENLERLRSQVALDEQRTLKAMLAGAQLSTIEFRTCPRCLQQLPESEQQQGHCMLCGQPEPASLASVTLEDELERLRGQQRGDRAAARSGAKSGRAQRRIGGAPKSALCRGAAPRGRAIARRRRTIRGPDSAALRAAGRAALDSPQRY
jgi:AAA domain